MSVNTHTFFPPSRILKNPDHKKNGVSLPPANTGIFLSNVISQEKLLLQAIPKNIPEYYDLRKKYDFLYPVFNQYQCGSCWAVSSTTAFSDCIAIAKHKKNKNNKDPNPFLSPEYLLACCDPDDEETCSSSNKCDGGSIEQAANFYLLKGGISSKCVSKYGFCQKECQETGADQSYLNDSIPACPTECDNNKESFKPYYAKSIKRFSITGSETDHIKAAIMKTGPVIFGFWEFMDFAIGGIIDNWKSTNGVYIHKAYDTNHTYNSYVKEHNLDKTSCTTNNAVSCAQDGKKISSCLRGGHAVTIVGWGWESIGKQYDYKIDNKRTGVEYWIVRNSYGDKWGDKGYFKMAIASTKHNLNDCLTVQLDTDASGGFIVMEPYLELKENYEGENKISGLVFIVLGIFVITLGIAGWLYYKKNKK